MLSGPPVTVTLSADQWLERFLTASSRQRRTLLSGPQPAPAELTSLIPERLAALDATADDWAPGCLIQTLIAKGTEQQCADFRARYPDGWLAVSSAAGLDFSPLQAALANQSFEEADRLTSSMLRQLAGPSAEQRGYVYYSEVPGMSGLDLHGLGDADQPQLHRLVDVEGRGEALRHVGHQGHLVAQLGALPSGRKGACHG